MLWKAENVLLSRHRRRGNRPSEPYSLVDVWDAVLIFAYPNSLFIRCETNEKPQRNNFFLKNACAIEKSCTFAAQFASGNPKIGDYRLLKTSGNSSVGRARPCQGRGREFESRFPLRFCGNSSVGRARPCQGRGREFESRFPLHKSRWKSGFFV